MAPEVFRVVFADSAWRDLEEIVAYWTGRHEQERGEQYAVDLPATAISRLSDPNDARRCRFLRHTRWPDVRELPVFKNTYRILYRIDEPLGCVHVLRFWHSHRDEPPSV
ncbi:MAG TPA: type II toxin-antitoxin system RelE/ParE family toxin [Verrucomicrobiales bacterium]|jgi:plasmid stabilization system protein ParE|nr:type II toxin-antitoxin system RelE/ParE family toxin [Verrucomicrobiales bacterium]